MRLSRKLAVGIATVGVVAGTLTVTTVNSYASSCATKHANVVLEEGTRPGADGEPLPYLRAKIGLNTVTETPTECVWHGDLVEQLGDEIISQEPTTHRERKP